MDQKTAIISGGLGDIGKAIAVHLGRKGHNIALCDLKDAAQASQDLDMLRSSGCNELMYSQVDVTKPQEVEDWLCKVEENYGTPQVVIPNAGIVIAGMLTALDFETVQQQIAVNFWGSYHIAIKAATRLKNAGMPGRIVFIGSWAAERPHARIPAYCISKASLHMLCKTLALELAEFRILVNEVAPGIIDGGLSRKNQQADPALLPKQLEAIPLHTLISPQEVADCVSLLCSFENSNITGSTILLDGGLSLTSKMSR